MADLLEKIKAEEQNVEEAIRNLEAAMDCEEYTVIELAAAATFLHNIYSGIENILKQTLKEEEIKITQTEGWHKEMLKAAENKKIITKSLHKDLLDYLAFRHFFVHGFRLKQVIE